MKIEPMPLEGAAVVQVEPFADHRGLFARFFCDDVLQPLLDHLTIRQVNFSSNYRKGTLRGLHYQYAPHTDLKLVRCLCGATHHVVVDIRPESPTYLKWEAVELQAETMNMLCVPQGFAHGFQSLQNHCQLMYLVTHPYAPRHQGGLRYDDPSLGITWPLEVTEISDRDARHALLHDRAPGAAA